MERQLYKGWLKITAVDYGGKTYEKLHNHDAVACIVLDGGGKLLLVEQYRPALGVSTLEIPAGIMDKADLTPAGVMAEELWEEAELQVKPENLREVIRFKPIVGFSDSQMIVFYTRVAEVYSSYAVADCDVYQVHWLTFEDFEAKVLGGLIYDNKTVMAYYYLKALGVTEK